MYMLVNAVNQQFDDTFKSSEMLVLTKFAELAPNVHDPVYRLSIPRLAIITHLSENAVRSNLKNLSKRNALIPLDGGSPQNHRGRAYKLILPEGYDESMVKSRLGHYYACRDLREENKLSFGCNFPKKQREPGNPVRELSPVMRNAVPVEVAPNHSQNSVTPLQNLDRPPSRICTTSPAESAPINKYKENSNNNNIVKDVVVAEDGGSVMEDGVWGVMVEAAKATGGWPEAFENCGITKANSKIAIGAISLYERQMSESGGGNIRNNVGYLISMIKTAIKRGGVETMVSPVMRQESGKRVLTEKERAALCANALESEWNRFISQKGRRDKLGRELAYQLKMKYKARLSASLGYEEIIRRGQKFHTENINAEYGKNLTRQELYDLLESLITSGL